jgi:hypothetical protein
MAAPTLPSTTFIRSPIWLFMNCPASQPAIPPMMIAEPTDCLIFHRRSSYQRTVSALSRERDPRKRGMLAGVSAGRISCGPGPCPAGTQLSGRRMVSPCSGGGGFANSARAGRFVSAAVDPKHGSAPPRGHLGEARSPHPGTSSRPLEGAAGDRQGSGKGQQFVLATQVLDHLEA